MNAATTFSGLSARVALFAAAMTVFSALALERPVVHYRADAGVTVDGDGTVTKWANLGSLGAAADVIGTTGVKVSASGALVFDGTGSLSTAGDVNLGISAASGGSWFVTFKSPNDRSGDWGLFGACNGTSYRLGAFHANAISTDRLRCYLNGSNNWIERCYVHGATTWQLLDLTCWKEPDAAKSTLRIYDGWYRDAESSTCVESQSVPLVIGNFGNLAWCSPFIGEIAELRCYSRALTMSERLAVQLEMALFAGVTKMDFAGLGLLTADNAACSHDIDAFGFRDGVAPKGAASGTSGGLTVSCEEDDLLPQVALAHNGGADAARVWCLAPAESLAEEIRVCARFSLAGEAAAAIPHKALLLQRDSPSDSWRCVGRATKDAKGEFAVTLDSWRCGYYQFVEDKVAVTDLVLHYRSDRGVTTDAGGNVVGWANLGRLGAVADVIGTTGVKVSASGALVFDGTGSLSTAGDVNLGISAASGGSWFVTFKSPNNRSGDWGLFGACLGATIRLGAFHPQASGSSPYFYSFMNGANYEHVDTGCIRGEDTWQLLDLTVWKDQDAETITSRIYDGEYRPAVSVNCRQSPAVPLVIGSFGNLDWCSPFIGEIAELRCYSRALTASERSAVQLEMAVYAGVKAMDFPDVGLFEAGNGAYVNELESFGYVAGIGPDEEPAEGARSGSLSVLYGDEIDPAADTTAYVAHDGAPEGSRIWCVAAKSADGKANPIGLTFSALKSGTSYKLYFSEDASKWNRVGSSQTATADGDASFELSANWQNGYYQIRRVPLGFIMEVR